MAQVTPIEVQQLYNVTHANDLLPFIETAALVVTEELAGSGLSAARLKQIELYLAAHFATVTLERGGLKRRKIGDSEDEYKVVDSSDKGIASTRFGQQAIVLDSSGILGALTVSIVKARFRVV